MDNKVQFMRTIININKILLFKMTIILQEIHLMVPIQKTNLQEKIH